VADDIIEHLLSGPRADSLVAVPGDLSTLVQLQATEIRQLRAVLRGLVEHLQAREVVNRQQLGAVIERAWEEVRDRTPAPPASKPVFAPAGRRGRGRSALVTAETPMTDPYRGVPAEPTPEMIEAAQALLQTAYKHHYARRFAEAREIYRKIIAEFGLTEQADTARQQLENLRGA
jgi:hypothetical protein